MFLFVIIVTRTNCMSRREVIKEMRHSSALRGNPSLRTEKAFHGDLRSPCSRDATDRVVMGCLSLLCKVTVEKARVRRSPGRPQSLNSQAERHNGAICIRSQIVVVINKEEHRGLKLAAALDPGMARAGKRGARLGTRYSEPRGVPVS